MSAYVTVQDRCHYEALMYLSDSEWLGWVNGRTPWPAVQGPVPEALRPGLGRIRAVDGAGGSGVQPRTSIAERSPSLTMLKQKLVMKMQKPGSTVMIG
jgi:hypothetical protein